MARVHHSIKTSSDRLAITFYCVTERNIVLFYRSLYVGWLELEFLLPYSNTDFIGYVIRKVLYGILWYFMVFYGIL